MYATIYFIHIIIWHRPFEQFVLAWLFLNTLYLLVDYLMHSQSDTQHFVSWYISLGSLVWWLVVVLVSPISCLSLSSPFPLSFLLARRYSSSSKWAVLSLLVTQSLLSFLTIETTLYQMSTVLYARSASKTNIIITLSLHCSSEVLTNTHSHAHCCCWCIGSHGILWALSSVCSPRFLCSSLALLVSLTCSLRSGLYLASLCLLCIVLTLQLYGTRANSHPD